MSREGTTARTQEVEQRMEQLPREARSDQAQGCANVTKGHDCTDAGGRATHGAVAEGSPQ